MSFKASDVQSAKLAARVVLDDCRICLARLEAEDDHAAFRINWVAMCALLRAVGHVLKDVDKPTASDTTKAAINARWNAWHTADPAHAIFRDFIKKERDAVLKEYEFGYGEEVVELVLESVETGQIQCVELPSGLYRPHSSSPTGDEDSRDVVQRAIDWWDVELSGIEATL